MILRANAKINLHLDVGPRMKNGYHTLDTVFQEISIHDTLLFTKTAGPIRLKIVGATLSAGPDNLIVRALTMLRDELGVKDGMDVRLKKEIPMGAGLGGGSSDAAAALWGGWMIWENVRRRPKTVPPVLVKCAPKLGADVAFFLRGGIARGKGIGDKLTSLKPQKKRWVVLAYPRVHVATPLAYRLLDEARASAPRPQRAGVFNSFEDVILDRFPEIASAKNALRANGCTEAMMSGSGSTVFGFVKDKLHGERVLRALKQSPWHTFLCTTLF